jgi:hypothetical protein
MLPLDTRDDPEFHLGISAARDGADAGLLAWVEARTTAVGTSQM